MAMDERRLRITYSMADQNFATTKSIGIFNLSLRMAEDLSRRFEVEHFTFLGNPTLEGRLSFPTSAETRRFNRPVQNRWQRMLWDQWGVYSAAKQSGNDWLFLPKGFASFVRSCPVRLATCVADVMQEYYGRKYPRSVSRMERLYFEQSFKATIRNSRVVFTISDFTSGEIARVAAARGWRMPPIKTIGIGFLREKNPSSSKRNSIAVLAGRFPHKRTTLAIEFFERWQRDNNFSGTVDWIGSLPNDTRLPNFGNWHLHSRLPETDYRRLIAEARSLVFFSEYEGFGMPPVEAALVNTCPVYSDIPVSHEVMDSTGFYFSNESYESFRTALENSLRVTPETVSDWAQRLLRRHSPEGVVDRVIQGLQEARNSRASHEPNISWKFRS